MLTLHTLPATKGRKKKRLGRGNASSGNYSGRGMKGQRSRSGGKGGLKLRGLKQSFMAVPKKRGFTSHHPSNQAINLYQLESSFENDATVDAAVLLKKGLITRTDKPVKILAKGKLTKRLNVKVTSASEAAQAAITAAGGTFEAIKA